MASEEPNFVQDIIELSKQGDLTGIKLLIEKLNNLTLNLWFDRHLSFDDKFELLNESIGFAAAGNYLKIIKYMEELAIENKWNGLLDQPYDTAIYYAAKNGHTELFKYVLQKYGERIDSLEEDALEISEETIGESLLKAIEQDYREIACHLFDSANDEYRQLALEEHPDFFGSST